MMKTIVSVIAFMLLTSMGPVTQVTITGRVTNTADDPLSGVTVLIRGTNVSVMTDAGGFYTINPGPGAKVLLSTPFFQTTG